MLDLLMRVCARAYGVRVCENITQFTLAWMKAVGNRIAVRRSRRMKAALPSARASAANPANSFNGPAFTSSPAVGSGGPAGVVEKVLIV